MFSGFLLTLFFKILYNKNDLNPLERTIALPFLILLIILLLIVVIGIVLSIVKTIRNVFRRTSSTFISTNSILKGLELVRLQEAYTPKSVSGMTRIYLPLIERDFRLFITMISAKKLKICSKVYFSLLINQTLSSC